MKFNEKHWAAITILAEPGRRGLTYKQIAEDYVGVSEQSLHKWRKNDAFNNEVMKQVRRNTLRSLPDVMDSVPKHIIKGNAAMLTPYLKMLGMLTDKQEVEIKDGNVDTDAIKARIAEIMGEDKE